MVIAWHGDSLDHVLPPSKLLTIRRTVSPLGNAENLGKPTP